MSHETSPPPTPPTQAAHQFMAFAGSVDFGKTAKDYARHRAGFPAELFERLDRFGVGRPGQRVLDLGTGTGTVARSLALRGCAVTAIDPSAVMLEQAAPLDQEAGVRIDYRVGKAEETGLPAESFDVVTAGQCWHWFDAPRAAAEVRRLLVPGGTAVICNFDWIPLPGNVVDLSEKLIEKHNPAWRMGGFHGIHAQNIKPLAIAGFTAIETFSFDLAVPYTHEAWRGRIRASAGVSATLSPEAVAAFDAEHGAALAASFPADPFAVPHRCFAIVARTP